jgi:hypothetical protein
MTTTMTARHQEDDSARLLQLLLEEFICAQQTRISDGIEDFFHGVYTGFIQSAQISSSLFAECALHEAVVSNDLAVHHLPPQLLTWVSNIFHVLDRPEEFGLGHLQSELAQTAIGRAISSIMLVFVELRISVPAEAVMHLVDLPGSN